MDSYYALILIPLGTIVVITTISYLLGLKFIGSLGIGVLASVLSLVIIHPFHFDNGKLLPDTGNFYVSLYILFGILIFITLVLIAACKDRTRRCCCKKNDISYENAATYQVIVDVESNYNSIENYQDIERPKSDNIDIHTGYVSSETDSGVHPSLKFYKGRGSFVSSYKKSSSVGPTGLSESYISGGSSDPEILKVPSVPKVPYNDTDDDGNLIG